MSIYLKGLFGELQAQLYLKKKGVKTLEKRFRYGKGEIDLVCADGETICFVEVKYRPEGEMDSGVRAVDRDKKRRIRAAARGYLKLHPEWEGHPIRCDIL